jgi:hypothetical protein
MLHVICVVSISNILVRRGIKSVGERRILVEPVVGTTPTGEAWAMAFVIATPEMHSDEA